MITVHHFSNPVWVDDPRITGCEGGPTDTHLCGWGHETGGEAIIEGLAEHAALLAQRYGDRVDDWATLNEPVNYAVASYGAGQFPPGRRLSSRTSTPSSGSSGTSSRRTPRSTTPSPPTTPSTLTVMASRRASASP